MRGWVENRYAKSWTLVVDLGNDPITGQRDRRAKSIPKREFTEKQANTELRHWMDELEKGTAVKTDKITFGEFLQEWLRDYATHNVVPTTYRLYEMYVRVHLTPLLGAIKLQQLTARHLQSYYTDRLTRGYSKGPKKPKKGEDGSPEPTRIGTALSARSVLHQHRMVHKALEYAVKHGLTNRNVADMVDPPREEKAVIVPLAPAVVTRIALTLEESYGTIALLALWSGQREGEVLATRVKDVGYGYVNVEQTLHKEPGEPYTFGQTKGKRKRRARIPAQLSERLMALGKGKKPDDLLFTRPDGQPVNPSTVYDKYVAAAKKLGYKTRFHDIRHTHGTLLAEKGAAPRAAQEQLGHADAQTTLNIYTFVTEPMQDHLGGILEEAWEDVTKAGPESIPQ